MYSNYIVYILYVQHECMQGSINIGEPFQFNPYASTLFLDVALLNALLMNVCSDNASLFCTAKVLPLEAL